jgi:hypothetical protein
VWKPRRRGKSADAAVAHQLASRDAPIAVAGTSWQEQFNELWELLVPSAGSAETQQGEAIRLAGKLSREILDNGSINWNSDFRAMADALTAYPASLNSVADAAELSALRDVVRTGSGDKPELYRLTELTVAWVLANPTPIPLEGPRLYRN